ncbi:RHS repeat-associated core domain-containing protein [Pseudomonas sp. UBA6562]|uniref:RHS repeat-associated core domain-containing protein n=1 Tax=Pseudomonas sp. UBA6562 TaxID=1947332 RepID=UPI0025D29F10|nr:RHS repeat-associated core domain-containing protein [Pseudomonas sp. UBA6562]
MKTHTLTQFHYNKEALVTLKHNSQTTSIFRTLDLSLADYFAKKPNVDFLCTDQNGSVLSTATSHDTQMNGYSAYGHSRALTSLLAFNGEYLDRNAQKYILGSYRAFNTGLMRFESPDSRSPFDLGGINAYAYCQNDPINKTDPSGHYSLFKLLRGGYSEDRLYKRLKPAAHELIKYNPKESSLSKNELKAFRRDTESSKKFFEERMRSHLDIGYGMKGYAANSNQKESARRTAMYFRELVSLREERLRQIGTMVKVRIDGRNRYFTPENHEHFLNAPTAEYSTSASTSEYSLSASNASNQQQNAVAIRQASI